MLHALFCAKPQYLDKTSSCLFSIFLLQSEIFENYWILNKHYLETNWVTDVFCVFCVFNCIEAILHNGEADYPFLSFQVFLIIFVISSQMFRGKKKKKRTKKDQIKFSEVQTQHLVGLACLKIIFNTSTQNEMLSNIEL